MALPIPRPIDEVPVYARTTSIGATPVAASTLALAKGYLERAYAFSEGASSGTIAVAVAINGTTVGTITFTGGSNAVGSAEFGLASANLWVNDSDVITFTPSGGAGATIAGHFYGIISKA